MSRKAFAYLPILALVLCLLASSVFASDACGPTSNKLGTQTVKIPNVGTPETPASGVADGWVLIYKDSTYKQLNHEVYCQNNQIQFASTRGQENFVRTPDCTQTSCTKAVEAAKETTVSLRNNTGDENAFVWTRNDYAVSGFTVLHNFIWPSNGTDGENPHGPLIQDASGNLYGTTAYGGTCPACSGTVFELSPATNGSVSEKILYDFNVTSTPYGYPTTGLLQDAEGNLYGPVGNGGFADTIFELSPSGVFTTLWNPTNADGFGSLNTGLIQDSSGNLYTTAGGSNDGEVLEMSPGSGGTWTPSVIYSNTTGIFDPVDYGYFAVDSKGNMYGTSQKGGANSEGYVFKLSNSSGTWTLSTLYSFQGGTTDGCTPYAAPTLDASGNLYGTTESCGLNNKGTVWKLTPGGEETVLYNFCSVNSPTSTCSDGANPWGGVTLDPIGNLLGTTYGGAYNPSINTEYQDLCVAYTNFVYTSACGVLYEVSASGTYTVLHTFGTVTDQVGNLGIDGWQPMAAPLLGSDGNLYGTAWGSPYLAGYSGPGTVWAYNLYDPLSVTLAGTSTGTVTSSPAGLSCATGTCSQFFTPGATVTLIATPGSNSTFAGWGAPCSGTGTCEVTLSGATSVTATFTAQQLTSTTVSSNVNPSYYNQGVTLTATVTTASGTPTGTVTFYNGGTTLGTATLSSGTATFATAALPAGTDSITAVYGGNGTYAVSTSPALSQNVYKAETETTLSSSLNPSVVNQSVTFTATVVGQYGGTPTGTVTFLNGSSILGTAPLSGGTASYTTSFAKAGTYNITAASSGDSNFTGSTSAAVPQTVSSGTKLTTTTTVKSSKASAGYGVSVTFTATVKATGSTPTGSVTFIDEKTSTTLGTGTLSASGIATYSPTTPLAVGAHTIEASYPGNSAFSPSSGTTTQTVTVVATTTALTSSLNPSTSGTSVTFTATVKATGSTAVPTGTVTFYNGTTELGTGTLNASGVATYSTSTLTVGKHTMKAVYGATTDFKTSDKTLVQTVTAASE